MFNQHIFPGVLRRISLVLVVSRDGQVLAFCREALEGQSNELFGEPVEEVGGFSMGLDEKRIDSWA